MIRENIIKKVDIDIKELIPQREPILLVDRLLKAEESRGETDYCVKSGHFLLEKDTLPDVALVEHIAQSASALAGYRAKMTENTGTPPTGYIGEIKDFHCYRCPHVGERLVTKVVYGPEVGSIAVVNGETYVGDEKIADTQLKLFIQANE